MEPKRSRAAKLQQLHEQSLDFRQQHDRLFISGGGRRLRAIASIRQKSERIDDSVRRDVNQDKVVCVCARAARPACGEASAR